jgi:predicted metal-binding membrane protein
MAEPVVDRPHRVADARAPSLALAEVSRRDRIIIWTCLVALIGLSWAYLVFLDRQMASSMTYDAMMAEMGMAMDRSWTRADLFFTFVMWTVMMVGMMAGSAAPVLLLFGRARAGRGKGAVSGAVLTFGLGYVTMWTAFSACAALAQWGLHQAALMSAGMSVANPRVAGAILVGAGIYQLTPVKGACLTHCQSPLGFLLGHWREGSWGAFQMGIRHGAYCLGCCWALMAVLFAVGVMNLFWVAALALFVLLEKIGPAGPPVARASGVLLIGFGLFVGFLKS